MKGKTSHEREKEREGSVEEIGDVNKGKERVFREEETSKTSRRRETSRHASVDGGRRLTRPKTATPG